MTQTQRLLYMIDYLIHERADQEEIAVPADEAARKQLVQDACLQQESRQKGIVTLSDLEPMAEGIYLWQGDITRLRVDAIVNAANSALLGCFVPCHGCIDNAIHSAAGVQLRLECARIMNRQKTQEPTGKAKLTKAYNLPSRYVLHTVGPIIYEKVTEDDCALLADCYRSCLELAAAHQLKSIAFCCISTGEFRFPNQKAAEIAIETVQKVQQERHSRMEVVFNVFKDEDAQIYKRLLR